MNRVADDLISRAKAKDYQEKVIKGLERCLKRTCPAVGSKEYLECEYTVGLYCRQDILLRDILALLKAQEQATIEPKRIELADETKAWLDKMDAVDALGNIADICIDWDGYRTADGLGGLINEIWAYARYCADKLLKAQEPVEPKKVKRYIDFDDEGHPYSPETYDCGACGKELPWKANYCPECGKAVKWGD